MELLIVGSGRLVRMKEKCTPDRRTPRSQKRDRYWVSLKEDTPSRAKSPANFVTLTYALKPVPFKLTHYRET